MLGEIIDGFGAAEAIDKDMSAGLNVAFDGAVIQCACAGGLNERRARTAASTIGIALVPELHPISIGGGIDFDLERAATGNGGFLRIAQGCQQFLLGVIAGIPPDWQARHGNDGERGDDDHHRNQFH